PVAALPGADGVEVFAQAPCQLLLAELAPAAQGLQQVPEGQACRGHGGPAPPSMRKQAFSRLRNARESNTTWRGRGRNGARRARVMGRLLSAVKVHTPAVSV